MEIGFHIGGFEVKLGAGRRALPMGNYGGEVSTGGSLTGRNRWFGLLPGTSVDFDTLAGDRWRNSIVQAAVNWVSRNMPQAPPCVYLKPENGPEQVLPGHPLTALRRRPNRYYDGRTLMQATALSLIAGRGNAYWYVVRDNAGRPIQLWYLPHFQCWPVWDGDSDTDSWITGYAYRQGGQTMMLRLEDVIHFRDGLDPYNQRSGLDPLASGVREIVADNQNSTLVASLLRNMGIPSLIISPDGDNATFQEPDADAIKAAVMEKISGDNAGSAMVLSGSVRVDKLMMSPDEMMLDRAPNRWEARLCALLGINPVVLGLWSGLERSTYSNMEEAIRSAWTEGIIPRLELINSELDVQLLPYFDTRPNVRCGNDYSQVRALADNENDLYKRVTGAVQGPWMTANEGRALVGFAAIGEGDKLASVQAETTAARDAKQIPNDGDAQKRLRGLKAENGVMKLTPWAERALEELEALADAS